MRPQQTYTRPVYVIDGSRTPFIKARGKPGPFSAADLAVAGRHGTMVAMRGAKIDAVPLAEGCAEIRGVDPELYGVAQTFFG